LNKALIEEGKSKKTVILVHNHSHQITMSIPSSGRTCKPED